MGCKPERIKSRVRSSGSIIKKRIVIIGDGASGLAAAIGGAKNGAHVIIVEHMDRVGKKILSTGNNRCSLTNLKIGEGRYCRGQRGLPTGAIRDFGADETLAFFKGLGVEPKDRNGYIYPNSSQASAVLDVLRSEVERLGVVVLPSCRVEKIEPAVGGGGVRHKVYADQGILDAEAVVLAIDFKAAPSTDSDEGRYKLAKGLGHRIVKPFLTLVQLWCQGSMYRQMAGIRTEAGVKFMTAGELLGRDRGELQLTDCGLSGILVLQISRFAARALDQGKRVTVLVGFMLSWGGSEAFGPFRKRASLLGHKTVEELFIDLLNKKLAPVLIKLTGTRPSQRAGDLSPKRLRLLLGQMESYEAIVMLVNPFANAQVCCGGMDARETDAATMESRTHANLYLAGELLDVDGICGGYNPQFAWSSGMVTEIRAARGYFAETHETDRNRAGAYGAYGPAPGGKRDGK